MVANTVTEAKSCGKWSSETPVCYGNDNIAENGVAFLFLWAIRVTGCSWFCTFKKCVRRLMTFQIKGRKDSVTKFHFWHFLNSKIHSLSAFNLCFEIYRQIDIQAAVWDLGCVLSAHACQEPGTSNSRFCRKLSLLACWQSYHWVAMATTIPPWCWDTSLQIIHFRNSGIWEGGCLASHRFEKMDKFWTFFFIAFH